MVQVQIDEWPLVQSIHKTSQASCLEPEQLSVNLYELPLPTQFTVSAPGHPGHFQVSEVVRKVISCEGPQFTQLASISVSKCT